MSLSDKRLITRDEASFEELCKRPTIFIVGHRQSGKTQALIELSEQTGIPILAPTRMMRDCIELQAKRQGRTIPAPQVYKPADFPPIQEQDRKTHGETYAPTRCRSISQTVSTHPVTSPSILKT